MNAPAQNQQPRRAAVHPAAPDSKEPYTGWDENTFFLVVNEGDEDGRLRIVVTKRCQGVNPGKVVNFLPLQQLSERHSVVLVYRPHVPGERDMKKWPVRFAGPVKAEDYWNEVSGLHKQKFKLALGSVAAADGGAATVKYKDEIEVGTCARLHYA
jgi:hypothetical protein